MSEVKFATLGGDGQDAEFEKMFSQLAHAYTAAKAPSLEPYEIGFQLLERTEDGHRAAGVTGFVMGTQLLLAPVFWLSGKIKGTELLWVDSARTFVPLKDNWLNYIQQRKPLEIGDTTPKDLRRLGVRQPVMSNYKHARTAAWLQSLAAEPQPLPSAAVAAMKTAFERGAAAAAVGDLVPRFLRTLGKRATVVANRLLDNAPALVAKAAAVYGSDLRAALQDAAQDVPQPLNLRGIRPPEPACKLAVTTGDGPHTLGHTKYAVADERPADTLTKAYRDAGSTRLFNPPTSGLYDILTHEPAGIRKCLVVLPADFPPQCSAHGCSRALVVDLDSSQRPFCRQPLNELWAVKQYADDEFSAWASKLPAIADVDTGVVLVLAFPEARRLYGPLRTGLERSAGTFELWAAAGILTAAERMRIDSEGGRALRTDNDTLFVPPAARYLVIDTRDGASAKSWDTLVPQSHPTLAQLLAKYARVSVFVDGQDVTIKTAAGTDRYQTPFKALEALMRDHALPHEPARELLDTAGRVGQASAMLKRAAPIPTGYRFGPADDVLGESPESSTPIMGGDSITTRANRSDASPIDVPNEEPERKTLQDHDVNRVDSAAQLAMLAAGRGQRDVFDAATLVTMLRTMRDEDLIDRSIPTLAAAMGEVGALLYKFFWHQDDFAERFGDDDMPDMEDALRNLLEGLGDMVLKLRQKTIAGGTDVARLGVSLNDLAGAP